MGRLIRKLRQSIGFNPWQWVRASLRMRQLVREFESQVGSPGSGEVVSPNPPHFAVLLVPWLGTSVPWYSLMCGLLLRANGSKVTFIFDDLPFGPDPLRFRFVLGCIRFVLRASRHETLTLSGYRGPPGTHAAAADVTIERLAQLNAVWALKGESSEPGRRAYVERSVAQLNVSAPAIASLLARHRCDAILIPGGVYGSSGLWARQASAQGLRIASFDSGGPGVTLLCASGIACQLQDIPRALKILKASLASKHEAESIAAFAAAEVGRRRAGTDKFASQIPGSRGVDSRYDGAVLIALNSSWDSAALGLHTIFESSAQWIVDTARFVLENTNAPVVIRQHPAERTEAGRSSDDYAGLLQRNLGSHPRLHFISAADPVNSYELLERVALLVVYTSTIGVEAAMSGKIVITPSRSYYSDMGFVWKSDTLADYQRDLLAALAGRYEVTATMREDATFCYYLTQCCNWVHSPFSPESFADWSRLEPAEFLARRDIRPTVQSLSLNLPVAILNHRARLQARQVA